MIRATNASPNFVANCSVQQWHSNFRDSPPEAPITTTPDLLGRSYVYHYANLAAPDATPIMGYWAYRSLTW